MKKRLLSIAVTLLVPLFLFPFANVQNDRNNYDPVRNTRWGNDIFIMSDMSGPRAISYDYDSNTGAMYAAILSDNADTSSNTEDTLYIYKSSNYGSTWYPWYLEPNYGSNKPLDMKILVIQDADTPYVAFFQRWQNYGGTDNLYLYKIPEYDSSKAEFVGLINESNDSISVHSFDASYSDTFLFVVYNETDSTSSSWFPNNIIFRKTKKDYDSTDNWSDPISLSITTPTDKKPVIATTNNNVYISYMAGDKDSVLVTSSSDNGENWSSAVSVDVNPDSTVLSGLAIAADYDSIVWVGITSLDTTDNTNTNNSYYYYSIDNGQTFTFGDTLHHASISSWHQYGVSMAMAKNNSFVTIALEESYYNNPVFLNNVLVGYIQSSNPGVIAEDSFVVVNDSQAYMPVAGNRISSGAFHYTFSCAIFSYLFTSGVVFDSYNNQTGVSEKIPNISDNSIFNITKTYQAANGMIKLNLITNKKVNLNAAVYNISGQRIRTIYNGIANVGKHTISWDGRDTNYKSVRSGIYLIKVNTDNCSKTTKVLLLK